MISNLRELNLWSVAFRLTMALLCGGLIGIERGSRHKAAGFRTYMLVCIGAALTMLLGQYEAEMLNTVWVEYAAVIGLRTDTARFSAQVISGIGFLGTGTIIVTAHQSVKGLTTAAALWASACMGLVIGAGYYECVCLGFFLIFFCVRLLDPLETHIVEKSRYMNLYVEFETMDNVRGIAACLRECGIDIYDVDLDYGKQEEYQFPNAVFTMHINGKASHAEIVAALFQLEHIKLIEEV